MNIWSVNYRALRVRLGQRSLHPAMRCALWLILAAQPAAAEFLQTAPGVFQNTSLTEKIIVSYRVPGIFIVTGSPIDVQLFHPEQLKVANSSDVFVSYDPSQGRYSRLLTRSNEYRIKGNFTLLMGDLRIAVDNSNPYLSITLDRDNSIVGFRGLEPVINATGDAAITLLEANLISGYSDLIAPYLLSEGALFLRNKKLLQNSLGLSPARAKNPCLRERTIFVTSAEIAEVRKARAPEQQVQRLAALLKSKAQRDPLENSLIVRISKDSITTLNYVDGTVRNIMPMQNKFSARTICVVQEVGL